MKILNLLEQLEQRVKIPMKFNTGSLDLSNWDFMQYAEHMLKGENAAGSLPKIGEKIYTATDMCLIGPGDQNELAKLWNLPLPEDYLLFCSRFEEYLFSGGAFIRLLRSDEILNDVLTFRDVIDWGKDEPHRLFNFAVPKGQSGYYSFRWSADYSKLDIVFVWDYGDVTVSDLLGKNGDRYVSDPDFTSWLERMLTTNCTPLFPAGDWPMSDGGYYEDDYVYFKRLE